MAICPHRIESNARPSLKSKIRTITTDVILSNSWCQILKMKSVLMMSQKSQNGQNRHKVRYLLLWLVMFVLEFLIMTLHLFIFLLQADMGYLKGARFLVFGVVLFVWEFLPTFIGVIFFRVKKFASRVVSYCYYTSLIFMTKLRHFIGQFWRMTIDTFFAVRYFGLLSLRPHPVSHRSCNKTNTTCLLHGSSRKGKYGTLYPLGTDTETIITHPVGLWW